MGGDDETSGKTSRRRTDADRRAIVTESFEVGQSVSAVAERHGVSAASIYLWRRQEREGAGGAARKAQDRSHPPSPVTLVPVQIASAPEAPARPAPRDERIAIRLANGRILEVCEGIDPMQLVRLVAALESTIPVGGGP
jgi:transposase